MNHFRTTKSNRIASKRILEELSCLTELPNFQLHTTKILRDNVSKFLCDEGSNGIFVEGVQYDASEYFQYLIQALIGENNKQALNNILFSGKYQDIIGCSCGFYRERLVLKVSHCFIHSLFRILICRFVLIIFLIKKNLT